MEIEITLIEKQAAVLEELAVEAIEAPVEPAPANVDEMEYSTMEQETSRGNLPTPVETYTGLHWQWHLTKWNILFAISCVLSVSIDPLSLYIPLVNEDRKCFRLDRKLKIEFLVLRAFTDTFYIIDILLHTFTRPATHAYEALETTRTVDEEVALNGGRNSIKRTWWSFVVVDMLAVAPFPYLVFTFHGMLQQFSLSNTFVLFNYGPRIYRIYVVCEQLKEDASIQKLKKDACIKSFFFWAKLSLKLTMLLIASHVLGSFWYFFSFQEKIRCWKLACQKETGCNVGGFRCNYHTSTNRTLLKDLCPSNSTVYDFGIYLDAIQSGILESTNFLQKLSYCFWWGLQNLSSFGSNLKTSSNNVWQNLFAAFITISGMILFLIYLTGIIEKYVKRNEENQKKLADETKRIEKELDIEQEKRKKRLPEIASWVDENHLPAELKEKIMDNVINNLRADLEVNTKNLHFILCLEDIRNVKYHLCLPTLEKVPVLGTWQEELLKALCEYLTPVIYDEGSHVFREGEPIDKMVFITKGKICTYTITNNSEARSSSNTVKDLRKGSFFGEDIILHWESEEATSYSDLPFSKINVKCSTKVEAFILMPEDLLSVVDEWLRRSIEQTASSSNTRVTEHPPLHFSDLFKYVRYIQNQKKEEREAILRNMLTYPIPHAV